MSNRDRKIDQFMSVIVLLLYAVVIAIKWIMVYRNVPASAIKAMDVISTIILCLILLVVLYNALGYTDNLIMKIVFIAIALFLIASAIAVRVPSVQEFFTSRNIPLII
ncbi:MAG: hypothetical protein J1G04_07190 [Clostridiales bacterium]|nr:hypothetical protein [Clostridiales bacterium]